MANNVITVNNARIILKNGTEANWNKVTDFIPKKGEMIIYNPDDKHSTPRFKVGNGQQLPKDLPFVKTSVSQEDLENITAAKLKHSLTFGANGAYRFDGSEDVIVPAYTGEYNIE